MKKEIVLLANLNCPSCAADLQKALAKLDGVQRAEVAFGSGSVELEYDDNVVKSSDIDRTIESFGVTVAARM